MPLLTRRRMQDVHQETWLIFHGDIRVGTIRSPDNSPSVVKAAITILVMKE